MKKQLLLSILLLFPMLAIADDSGTCGNGVTYFFEEATGILTIRKTGDGNGEMTCHYWDTYYYNSITKVVIEAGVTSIGVDAFYGCSGLTSVTIPNSVTSIGGSAFAGCSGLTSVIIPNSVTYIGGLAFYDCSSLTSVTIPNSVAIFGGEAFAGCSGLTSISVSSGNTKYDSRNNCNAIIRTATNTLIAGCKNTTIPNSVTSIGTSAFRGCSGLTSVTIPNSVTSIGTSAFEGCSGLTSVTIPNSVTSIGSCAFYGCSGLTSVTIPNSVTSIDIQAFYGCSGLTSVTIPNSVTSISNGAFSGCSSLTSVVSEITTPFAFGSSAFKSIASNCTLTVPAGTKDAYIAAGWTEEVFKGGIIESTSNIIFADANVKALCVANWDTDGDGELSMSEAAAVTDLGTVFKDNTNINSFDELQYFVGLTAIGDEAFYYCTDLRSVTIPNSVMSIGSFAFAGCNRLTSVTIPYFVTSIGEYAFAWCSLTSVTIPNSVTSIGNCAFWSCSPLKSITIPNSVTSIGIAAFAYCSSLTSISVASGNTEYDSRNNCNAIIETASNTLIAGCKNTIIPNSVTRIEDSAFQGCTGLTSVTIPNSVTSIGDEAFFKCSRLTSVTIPNSVTSIGDSPFADCSGLTSISVASDNTEYDSRNNCNAIISTASNILIAGCKNTTIPNSVTSIAQGAFRGCSGLTSVTIPNLVTSINGWAFTSCINLTSVTIPNSVTSIGEYAFYGCRGLTSVVSEITTPFAFGTSTFSSIASNCTLTVPAGTKDAYIAAGWTEEVFKGGIIEMGADEPEQIEVTDISQLDNVIYIEPMDAFCGTQTTLSVKMKNNVAVQTVQFDLYLPEGFTVVPNDDNELITPSKERIGRYNYFESSAQADGVLRLLAQATTTNIPAGDGEICRLVLDVPESMEEGEYPIVFKDALMVEQDNTGHSPSPNIVQCKLTVLAYTPGDANNDGGINAIDFNMIGNYILGHSQTNFIVKAADISGDGFVNAIDFNMVGNIILHGSSAPSRATRKESMIVPQ